MVQATAKRPTNGADRTNAVLRLTKLAGPPIGFVSIDDKMFELADPSHFGLREGSVIWRSMARIAELETLADSDEHTVSSEEEAEYRKRLLHIAHAALPEAPPAALEKLPTGQLADLAVHFFAEAAKRNPRLSAIVRQAEAMSRSTGTTSSRSSSASTAAARSAG